MDAAQRFNRVMNRVYDRLRHRSAFRVASTWDDGIDGPLTALRGSTYALLITFRRTGEAVPSPVWFAVDGELVVIRTFADSGKVKRIAHDRRVLIAPATMRGRPRGPALRATARRLPRAEWARAEAALERSYGLGRRMYEGAVGEPEDTTAYLELTPTAGDVRGDEPPGSAA